jgi:HD-GYP domain-containing protein (c-di-GMP phosphodiesterase class II)
MNNLVRVPRGFFQLGCKLSHDVFDRSGKLLLRNGTPLQSEDLAERLEDLGYYDPEADGTLPHHAQSRPIPPPVGYRPDRSGTAFSAFTQLTLACERLEAVFAGSHGTIEQEVLEIAGIIHQSCIVDSDASLSAVLLSLPFAHIVRHPVNVAIVTATVLLRQRHDDARLLAAIAAALTMNIGALELHESLFQLSTALSDEQRTQVRAHPGASVDHLLARAVRNPLWLAIVAQHHEALDGSGYPAGLAGEKILPEAQVVSLADRYCAMVAERTHRAPMLPPNAIKEIHARHGNAVAPTLIAALISSMGIYPPGTCVRLANGDFAVVVHRLLDPRHPVVYSIGAANGAAYDPPRKHLTAAPAQFAITESILRKQVIVDFSIAALWPPTIAPTAPAAA